MIRTLATALVLLTANAAQSAPYVACDNGLRCVRAPCPSTNILNLASGKLGRVGGVDLSKLPTEERGKAERAEAVYSGSLVLDGVIAGRQIASTPSQVLVVKRVGRKTTSAERRMCRSGRR